MPAVSVVMPVYNTEKYLADSIASVLQQTLVDIELVMVDDGSRDNSLAVARLAASRDSRVKVISRPNTGVVGAYNDGVAAATGRYITFVDSDDTIPQDRLERQWVWIEQHPEFGAICGQMVIVDPTGRVLTKADAKDQAQDISPELREGITRTSLCTFVIRREVMDRVGPFRPYFITAEDIDFQMRLGEATRVWFASEITYSYRLHQTSITHTQPSVQRIFFDATAREFQRQRKKTGTDDLAAGNPPKVPDGGSGSPDNLAAQVQGHLFHQAWMAHRAGRKAEALRVGWQACWAKPSSLQTWRSWLALAAKPSGRV